MLTGVEIACDESGSEGENVTRSTHPVFVHAAVEIGADEAADLISSLRSIAPSASSEYKAEHLLRSDQALRRLLDNRGGVADRATVYLVDKNYFIVAKVIDLLVEETTNEEGIELYASGQARVMAWTLHREGLRALGDQQWALLLDGFNSLMRIKQRSGAKATVEEFFSLVGSLRHSSRRRAVDEVLDLVWKARPHAERFQSRLLDDPEQVPSLDPLVAALSQTARTWFARSGPVRIVHDRQAVLTPKRVADIIRGLRRPHPDFAHFARPVVVTSIEQVDSRDDPRVQVADLLAGAARQLATAALGEASPTVGSPELLQPFVDPWSLWCETGSWRALTGRNSPGH